MDDKSDLLGCLFWVFLIFAFFYWGLDWFDEVSSNDPNLAQFQEVKFNYNCESKITRFGNYPYENEEQAVNLLALGGIQYAVENYKEAFDLVREAAEIGDPEAQYNLASFYAYGEGVSLDYEKSLFWAQKSANQDFIGGQILLATLYANGVGVKRDFVTAYMWSMLAARRYPERDKRWYYSRDFETGTTQDSVNRDTELALSVSVQIYGQLSSMEESQANSMANEWLCGK